MVELTKRIEMLKSPHGDEWRMKCSELADKKVDDAITIIKELQLTLTMTCEALESAKHALANGRHLLMRYGDTAAHPWIDHIDKDMGAVKQALLAAAPYRKGEQG